MIAYLHGLLAYKGPTSCIIDVNGVGYELGMSTSSLSQVGAIGDDVSVFTSLQVKEADLGLGCGSQAGPCCPFLLQRG